MSIEDRFDVPWEAKSDSKDDVRWHVVGMSGWVCSDWGSGAPEEKRKVDAHLIAAAPDLLAALEELLVIMRAAQAGRMSIDGSTMVDSFTLQPAELAIAKAKGNKG